MNKLKKLIEDGLKQGTYSAISIEVVKNNNILLSEIVGDNITKDHRYDLASLTKPLSTAMLASILLSNKTIDRKTNIGDIYSEYDISLNPVLSDITIQDLLDHSSGLEAWFPIYKTVQSRSDAYMFIRSRTPSYKKNEKHLYSDLGYIMLGEIIEVIFQKRLDYLFDHYISSPLNLRKLGFVSTTTENEKQKDKFVTTGYSEIRNKDLCGEVNDENAFVLEGVAGHAGLFGTIDQTSKLATRILNIIKGKEEHDHIKTNTLLNMIERSDNSEWACGWHYPSAKNSSSGTLMSKNSIGMTGFTGTSIWIDIDREIVITVLSNRTIAHDSAKFGGEADSFTKMRPLIHDTIMGELI